MENTKIFIIAEAGVNHNNDKDIAFKLIEEAKKTGVDAIKFQNFYPEKIVSKTAKMATYQEKNIKISKTQFEMLSELCLSDKIICDIKEHCDKMGILFLSTPSDYSSVDFIEKKIPYFKVGSGDLTNLPLLAYIAKKNKPIILSTGMSYLYEVEKAILTIQNVNPNLEIFLLHCTTNYPCPIEEVNLKAMLTLKEAFKLPVGYSDHTQGIEVAIAAAALGARIIEKHFTLDKKMNGPDHKASLEPCELKEMVAKIRNIEIALGNGRKKPNSSEISIMRAARKVLIANKELQEGDKIKNDDIEIKRAENGISPYDLEKILNRKLVKNISEDETLTWDHFLRN